MPIRYTYATREPSAGGSTRAWAAITLEISLALVDKLLESGYLPDLRPHNVAELAEAHWITVLEDDLPILRTAPKNPDPKANGRAYRGASSDMSDEDFLEANNRWWRANPDRIVKAGVLPVAIAGFIVGVQRIHGVVEQRQFKQADGQVHTRYHFDSQLVCRMDNLADSASRRRCIDDASAAELGLLGRRAHSVAGGPIAYVNNAPGTMASGPTFGLG